MIKDITVELTELLETLNIPAYTTHYTGKAPDTYVVLTPMSDDFGFFADDKPQTDIQDVRIGLYTKSNYIPLKNKIVKALMDRDYYIMARDYIEYETDTGYHHYNIDVAQVYETEDIYGNNRT